MNEDRIASRRDLLNRYKSALPTIDLLKDRRGTHGVRSPTPRFFLADFDAELEKAREKFNVSTTKSPDWNRTSRDSKSRSWNNTRPPPCFARKPRSTN